MLLGLYMLVKNVVGIQTLILQGEWEKFVILSVVYESIGRKERMLGFVERLLLGLLMEK